MRKNSRKPGDDQAGPGKGRRERLRRHARLRGDDTTGNREHDWPTPDDHDKPRQTLAEWLRAHADEYARHGAAGRLVARELSAMAADAERLGATDPAIYERLVREEEAGSEGRDEDAEGYERSRAEWDAAPAGERPDEGPRPGNPAGNADRAGARRGAGRD